MFLPNASDHSRIRFANVAFVSGIALRLDAVRWPGAPAPIRWPYVDALSVTHVLALGSLRKRVDKEELTHGQKENYTYLILCTVSGVAAGLQNTG